MREVFGGAEWCMQEKNIHRYGMHGMCYVRVWGVPRSTPGHCVNVDADLDDRRGCCASSSSLRFYHLAVRATYFTTYIHDVFFSFCFFVSFDLVVCVCSSLFLDVL